MKFKIEQLAIAPRDPVRARQLLQDMGAVDWVDDHVKASGTVYGFHADNEADLAFNYSMLDGKELELLNYTAGPNWIQGLILPIISHLGMHVTEEELEQWRTFFAERAIGVTQEVNTTAHTNAAIAGKRLYHYVIFATMPILGVDIKFIVRKIL